MIDILKTNLKNYSAMNVEKMEKVIPSVVEKLEKIKQTELASELSWCWVSFKNDSNPVGLIEKSGKALAAFAEAREKNAKAVAKKLVEDFEKALA